MISQTSHFVSTSVLPYRTFRSELSAPWNGPKNTSVTVIESAWTQVMSQCCGMLSFFQDKYGSVMSSPWQEASSRLFFPPPPLAAMYDDCELGRFSSFFARLRADMTVLPDKEQGQTKVNTIGEEALFNAYNRDSLKSWDVVQTSSCERLVRW